MTQTFRRYGLPARLLMDNGPPWGVPLTLSPFTPLTVWLIRLGIGLTHARPAHPQTLGKEERFHRTLKAELLHQRAFRDLPHCQQHFDRWRDHYNLERPHDALALAVPATRYTPSPRPFPEVLPPIDYGTGAHIRRVQWKGEISFRGRRFHVTKALRGFPVAVRPTPRRAGGGSIFVSNISARWICSSPQNNSQCVNHVPEHPLMMSPVYTGGQGD